MSNSACKTFALFFAGFSILIAFGLFGCSAPDNNGILSGGIDNDNGSVFVPLNIKTDYGQAVVTISYKELKPWLESHRNIRITCISPIDKASHGSTTAFLIVYEPLAENPRKCPDCGQQLPAEKAN